MSTLIWTPDPHVKGLLEAVPPLAANGYSVGGYTVHQDRDGSWVPEHNAVPRLGTHATLADAQAAAQAHYDAFLAKHAAVTA